MSHVAAAVTTVKVIRKTPWFRVIGVIVLILWLFYTYFVAPALRSIDKVTPWDGLLPFSPISCGGTAPTPTPKATGFPAMWHDLGTGLRTLAAGPPSPEQMRGWYHSVGSSAGEAVTLVSGGLEGKPAPIPLAPPLPAPAPMQVSAQGALTPAQIAALATEVGWPAAEVPNVVSRVMAESSGNPMARDYADGTHHGLLQLGMAEQARYMDPGTSAFDPKENLRGALRLHRERGRQPWAASDAAVQQVSVGAAAPVSCAPGSAPGATWVSGPSTGAMVEVANGQRLRDDVAPAYMAMAASFQATFGKPLILTSGYRSDAQQARLYAEHQARGSNLAAPAGKSKHRLGIAADLGSGVNHFGTPEHEWMRANAGRFGFHHPAWAQRSGSKPEPWHWEYIGAGTPAG